MIKQELMPYLITVIDTELLHVVRYLTYIFSRCEDQTVDAMEFPNVLAPMRPAVITILPVIKEHSACIKETLCEDIYTCHVLFHQRHRRLNT